MSSYSLRTPSERRAAFLSREPAYGAGDASRYESLVSAEFSRLVGVSSRAVYADHAGSALYSERQLRECSSALCSSLLANPHSSAPGSPAGATAAVVSSARAEVAAFLGAPLRGWSVVWTSGATGALKAVGEAFAWSAGSCVCFLRSCHNSALGIRELRAKAAPCVDERDIRNAESDEEFKSVALEAVQRDPDALHLLVAIAEYDLRSVLRWIREDERVRGRWRVVVDAAALAAHSPLAPLVSDESAAPDYVALSLYKVFGYPTGLGVLLVRSDPPLASGSSAHEPRELPSADVLCSKAYFGGGTVAASLSSRRWHVARDGVAERLEDGTVNFTAVAAVKQGVELVQRFGGMQAVGAHACSVARYLRARLASMRHGGPAGAPAIVIAQSEVPDDDEHMGPVVTFNVRRSDGGWVGPTSVAGLAALRGIQLRAGCMCNPGACHAFVGLTPDEVIAAAASGGGTCWLDDADLIKGKPAGAVRASFGLASTWEDADTIAEFVSEYFVDPEAAARGPWPVPPPTPSAAAPGGRLHLQEIWVYPIKSCAGFSPRAWQISRSGGLAYDREWAVVDDDGKPLTMKLFPRLCFVRPAIDLDSNSLRVEAPGMPTLQVPLVPEGAGASGLDQVLLCRGERRCVLRDTSLEQASRWFSEYVGFRCTFIRAAPGGEHRKGFSNSSQFLVVTQQSFDDLRTRLPADALGSVSMVNFRANLVVSGAKAPYEEDEWAALRIGCHTLKVSGPCSRCAMTCVDQTKGVMGAEPLLTLAKYRNARSKLVFGSLCDRVPTPDDDNLAPAAWYVSVSTSVSATTSAH
eukprot:m51a1_g6362 putative molybdenum cofactor sulfurase-like (808) ;mRNA; f:105091-107808